jgi:YVTN family beta-propeller protein
MEFRILGPLEVRGRDRAVIDLGGRQQRLLVALLLLHPNEVVSVDSLIEALWPDQPPASAVKSIQAQISRVRRALGEGERLQTRGSGYLLVVEPGELDSDRFRTLLDEGREQLAGGNPTGAETTIREALDLWRGQPLADFVYDDFSQPEIARLDELRLSALEERFDAELALGRHGAVVAELEALVVTHPLRERLRGQLMLALYRSGRQAEALRAYEDARRQLAEELGLEPSEPLKRLQRSILDEDPGLDSPALGAAPETPATEHRRRQWPILAVAVLVAAGIVAGVLALTSGNGSREIASLAPNSLGIIDPGTNKLVAAIPVGARPAGIVYEHGALWVANLEDEALSRVDPVSRRVVRTVPLGAAPSTLVAGAGSVWVAGSDGLVRRIDPTFNTVSKRIRIFRPGSLLTSGSALAGAAFGYGAAWTATGSSWTSPRVSRIDAATNKVVAKVRTGTSPAAIAIGFGGIWVADSFENTVSRIDPTNFVARTIPVRHGPQAIAVGEGSVWVADTGDDTVVRIDPATNSVTTTIDVGRAPTSIAVSEHAVWVANSGDGTVSRIDPERNAEVETIHIGSSPTGIAVVRGSVWVTTQAAAPPARSASGGTARFDLDVDPQTDPALYPDRQINFATCVKLLSYPDKPAPAGTQLVPEVARSLPTRSADGRTYTFRIRKGFAFSPPLREHVTAETFKHSIERALDPKIIAEHGPAISFVNDIVGAPAFASGKADHVSGVVARGDKLAITLTRPAPSILARLAMSLFCAVPLNTPPSPQTAIPSAGPYYIASHVRNQQLVLRRNPNYHGPRPHRLDEIVYTIGISPPKSVTRVEQGRADYVAGRLPNEVDAQLAARYGPGSARQRYFVNPVLALAYLGLNTHRPLFSSPQMRRAVNYAIDRRALARQGSPISGPGAFTTIATDQYLPSTMPGFERTSIYPLGGDIRSARRLAGGRRRTAVVYSCGTAPDFFCRRQAQLVKHSLESIGIRVRVRTFPFPVMVARTFRKGEPWDIALLDWGADFADPSSFLDLLAPSVGERWQTRIDEANRLSPPARYRAFGNLAVELARDPAPWVSYANGTSRDFFSARMGCQVFQPVYGMDLGALCTRR